MVDIGEGGGGRGRGGGTTSMALSHHAKQVSSGGHPGGGIKILDNLGLVKGLADAATFKGMDPLSISPLSMFQVNMPKAPTPGTVLKTGVIGGGIEH